MTPLEEEHLIWGIKQELHFIPEVAKNEVITCWAQAVTSIIWEIPFLTETSKMQLSDIIDSNVSHVAYGPKLTVKQSYLKVAQKAGLRPDQVQVATEAGFTELMNLATELGFIRHDPIATKGKATKTASEDKATKEASKKGKGSKEKAKAAY